MAEWVRWQLGFGRLQRLQVQTPAEPKLFCTFSKIFEIFIKTTFLEVKNHEEHESGVKKIPRHVKLFKMAKFDLQWKFLRFINFKGFFVE